MNVRDWIKVTGILRVHQQEMKQSARLSIHFVYMERKSMNRGIHNTQIPVQLNRQGIGMKIQMKKTITAIHR
ncbi:hypothetical protein DPMN_054331 [Dreissena polymorpha]|uniref:Uncharacterized protein n=1 Tax=Dreissena polymorpha TaxID=45954 RepID=A0A9D4CPP1_DREPO|nr:hypothetical protein DPMN_054331 [Dreissena polymorpha]